MSLSEEEKFRVQAWDGVQFPDDEAVDRAVAVLEDLGGQRGPYLGVSWAVGVYEQDGHKRVYATSNESMGFLPPGLKWDPAVRLVFDVNSPLMPPWRGLANPARIVCYQYLRAKEAFPQLRLVAIASTAPYGDAVTRFAAGLGAKLAPETTPTPQPAKSRIAGKSLLRIESVLPDAYDALIAPITGYQRWAAAHSG